MSWPFMFAVGVVGILGGLAWFVLLVACVLFGDHDMSVFCAIVGGAGYFGLRGPLPVLPAADERLALWVSPFACVPVGGGPDLRLTV
jgi:hypothetical protein